MTIGEYKRQRLQQVLQSKKQKKESKSQQVTETPIADLIQGQKDFERRNQLRENAAKLKLMDLKNQR
jgi:hypothetical protein